MTPEQWEQLWLEEFNRYYENGRSVERSRQKAHESMLRKFGPKPEKVKSKLPWRYRILGKVALGRLEGMAKTMKEGSMGQRILTAVIFGVTAVLAALGASGIPQTQEGWLSLVGVFLTAFWGKFSSNQTLLAPDRKVWTAEQREEKLTK